MRLPVGQALGLRRASQAACTERAEGPPQRGALPHIVLEYVAGFLKRTT